MSKGFFISFEGIDGCGKSTQLTLLAKALSERGHEVYVTKEPGDAKAGANVGPGIRSMLFGTPGTKNIGPGVGDLLFLADHLQNAYDIEREIKAGKIILTDRYADSQFAYSSSPSKKAPEWAGKLFHQHYGPIPDLTFLFVVRGSEVELRPAVDWSKPIETYMAEEISWALTRANARRGVEAGKQAGKAWNDVEEQRTIQNTYLENLSSQPRTCLVDVWDYSSVEEIQEGLLNATLENLNVAPRPYQPVPVDSFSTSRVA